MSEGGGGGGDHSTPHPSLYETFPCTTISPYVCRSNVGSTIEEKNSHCRNFVILEGKVRP